MSIIEKILIISASIVPIVALLMFLPKISKFIKQKKSKKRIKPTQPYVSKLEEKAPTTPAKQSHAEDFKDYAMRKSKRISAPKRNFPTANFSNFEGFRPNQTNKPKPKEQTVLEEFKSLSPQLKALILSGALDRKDFDD